jgi:subtilisin family serine protease
MAKGPDAMGAASRSFDLRAHIGLLVFCLGSSCGAMGQSVGPALVVSALAGATTQVPAPASGQPMMTAKAPQPEAARPFQQAFDRQMLVGYEPDRADEVADEMKKAGLQIVGVYPPGGYIVCHWPAGFAAERGGPAGVANRLASLRAVRFAVPNAAFHIGPHARGQAVAIAGGQVGKTMTLAAPVSNGHGNIATYQAYAPGTRYVPNDRHFPRLWGMDSIRATAAWGRTQIANVIVAVTDTGVDYNHEDLAANLYRNPYEIPGDGLDNDGNGVVDDVFGFDATTDGGDPMDRNGHGTHCAGTIGALGNNAAGVAGVAWRVRIMAVRISDESGAGSVHSAVKGIDYASRNGAKVINASWGLPLGTPRSTAQPLFEAMARAGASGAVVVAAAGNDCGNDNDQSAHYPSSFADPHDRGGQLGNVISVAAIDIREDMSSFSNVGKRSVLIAAPGGHGTGPNCLATDNEEDILSTMSAVNQWSAPSVILDGGKYAYSAGTSMATPHVSGAIGLIWSLPEYNPLGPQEVRRLVLFHARRLESLKGRCATEGMLDISFVHPEPQPRSGDSRELITPYDPRAATSQPGSSPCLGVFRVR